MASVLLRERKMRLYEIMSSKVITIDAKQLAEVAWSRMQRHRIRHLVVLDDGHVVGMLSERDVGGRNGAELRKGHVVEELMTSSLVTADPKKMTLRQAANLMRSRKISSLPLLEGDELVGIVTSTDVLGELGRGSSRRVVQAQRRPARLPAGGKRRGGGRPIARTQPSGERKTGRARGRQPDSVKRAPFAGRRPRSSKRDAGRTESSETPANIRLAGVELGQEEQTSIRRKLGRKLGKFAPSIERVSVRIEDVNGPRGGVDQACRIKVVLSGLPSVVFQTRDTSLTAAIDGALTGVQRAVRRKLQRSRS